MSTRSLELAQKVADLILARGEVNGAVRKVDSPSLDERYYGAGSNHHHH